MKNLKNEGDSSPILQRDPRRSTPKPLETRQITLDSPCAKCGEDSGKLGAGRQPRESSLHCAKCGSFIRWLSAGELKRLLGAFRKNKIKDHPSSLCEKEKIKAKSTPETEGDPGGIIAEGNATEGIGGLQPFSEPSQFTLNFQNSGGAS